jgi:hypothetical protein
VDHGGRGVGLDFGAMEGVYDGMYNIAFFVSSTMVSLVVHLLLL